MLTSDVFICSRVRRLRGRMIDAWLTGRRHALAGVKGGVDLAATAVPSADQY